MAIQFHPRAGMVLICNFSTGFEPPEMVKIRRVIVVSKGDHNKHGVCTVVPFSTTPPTQLQPFHVEFPPKRYPFLHSEVSCWAKCNMINTVAMRRLDRIRVGGEYQSPSLNKEDLSRIYDAILSVFDR